MQLDRGTTGRTARLRCRGLEEGRDERVFMVVQMDSEYPKSIGDVDSVHAVRSSAEERVMALADRHQWALFEVHEYELTGSAP